MLTIFLMALLASALISIGKKFVTYFVITLPLVMCFMYIVCPSFTGPFCGIMGIVWFGCLIKFIIKFISNNMNDFDDDNTRKTDYLIAIIQVITATVLIAVAIVASLELFRINSYKGMIGDVKEIAWQEELPQVSKDVTQIRVLSEDMARIRSSRVLSQGGLGSAFHIGRISVQKIGDKLQFVSALEYNSVFQWLTQGKIPGYITVDAQDELAAAKDMISQDIVYSPEAYFNKDVTRHLYLHGYAMKKILDINFEVDEENKGWWVATIAKPTICWFADKIEGVAIVDPKTGDISFYDMEEIPEWVDRVMPETTFKERVYWAGTLKNGWLASWGIGNKRGLFDMSSEIWMTWNKDGEAKWMASCKNYGATDDSLSSIYQMDTRTGEVTFFTLEGAPINDVAAKKKAMGMVSDFGWYSQNPILYNVNGEPTWVSTLTLNGEYQGIACVHYEKEIRAYKREKADAIADYASLIKKAGLYQAVLMTKEGIVSDISSVVTGGESIFVFKVEGDSNIYSAKYADANEVAFVKKGDKVSFKCNEDETEVKELENEK